MRKLVLLVLLSFIISSIGFDSYASRSDVVTPMFTNIDYFTSNIQIDDNKNTNIIKIITIDKTNGSDIIF